MCSIRVHGASKSNLQTSRVLYKGSSLEINCVYSQTVKVELLVWTCSLRLGKI